LRRRSPGVETAETNIPETESPTRAAQLRRRSSGVQNVVKASGNLGKIIRYLSRVVDIILAKVAHPLLEYLEEKCEDEALKETESMLPEDKRLDTVVEKNMTILRRREEEGALTKRQPVLLGITVHSLTQDNSVFNVHISLKFTYKWSLIKTHFICKQPEEADSCDHIDTGKGKHWRVWRSKGEKSHIIPYMIQNAMEEAPISWMMKKTWDIRFDPEPNDTEEYKEEKIRKIEETSEVEERIEMTVTLAAVEYTKYFPDELRILFLKLQMDGTGLTSDVDLDPVKNRSDIQAGNTSQFKHDIRFGLLGKDTCSWKLIQGNDAKSSKIADSEYFNCNVYARFGRNDSIETSTYVSWIFEGEFVENLWKFEIVSTAMMSFMFFIPCMDVSSGVQTGLAILLADVALLFVMPPNDQFTSCEQIIVGHSVFIVVFTFFSCLAKHYIDFPSPGVIGTILVGIIYFTLVLVTFIFMWDAHKSFLALRHRIKTRLNWGKVGGNALSNRWGLHALVEADM